MPLELEQISFLLGIIPIRIPNPVGTGESRQGRWQEEKEEAIRTE